MLAASMIALACGVGDDTSAPRGPSGAATGSGGNTTASVSTAGPSTSATTNGSGTAGGGGGGADGGGGGPGIDGSNGGFDAGNIIDQLLALTQGCAKIVSSHTYKLDNGQAVNICGLNGAIYFTADMDIDCDGRNVGDGKCPGNDCCYQADTAFHNNAGQPLAASVTPYVVIPNDFHIAGLAGGNVVAVIYNRKLEFAVFGDTGPIDIIGEASYACAAALGINPDPGSGGIGGGVTYIAFTGSGSKPADIENQSQTATLGQQLAQNLLQNNP
jgi:glycosyl hydrolase group 75 (putative chitosanase)